MKFLDLYNENRKSVIDALRQMWCSETANDSQRAYARRISELIPELFAPSEAIPLVQCMNLYKPVFSVSNTEAEAVVDGYWNKIPKKAYYPPYEHQYVCWKHLLDNAGKPKSICVTTGTGSGKTECFMLPLVYDLDRQQKANPDAESYVQALFLYPLNALMEDQKERLEQLLDGTDLTYAVYNGDLPEKEPRANDYSDNAEQTRKQIAQIRGWDEATQTYRFKHILYTRESVRKRRPNILLTNPTMLEYILLRRKDEKLIVPEAKSLQWVAIDETHTYTGAGAAELAMLLRRVLLAFNVKAGDIHFATSSATFGNADAIKDPNLKAKAKQDDERKLKDFIAGITGTGFNQIEVVGGERVGESVIPNNEDHDRWLRIFKEEYVYLSSLFPDLMSVSDQLKALDEMIDRLGTRTDMKVKVHYFYRVPNNGIYVRLDKINSDGTFQLFTQNDIGKDNVPLVELARCKKCGEYVAIVRRDKDTGIYHAIEPDESDIFDLEDVAEDGNFETKIFSLSNQPNVKGQGNSIFILKDDKLVPALPGEVNATDWHLVANQHSRCTYCNCRLVRSKNSDGDLDAQTTEEISEDGVLKKFRLSAEFISRVIAPSVLDQLDRFIPTSGQQMLHDGQQYISFADSRQLAAKATLKQNQEQERMWFYTTVYHELCKRNLCVNDPRIQYLRQQLDECVKSNKMDEIISLGAEISKLESQSGPVALKWAEVADLIYNNDYCDRFCYEFVKRTTNSEETDNDGNIDPNIKARYVQSIMTMYLTSRPRSAAAPETMGLFLPCYEKLNKVTVPSTVESTFNEIFKNAANKIGNEDWKNLLQIFIDYRVRSDQSVYLEQPGLNIDIFETVRFAVEKSHRKPATQPNIEKTTFSTSRVVRYLCALIRRDDPSILTDQDAYIMYFDQIKVVIDSMWRDLVKTTNLLQVGRHKDKQSGNWINDADGGIRMNLADMSFKLYEKVYLCDTNSEHDDIANHAERLRPVETNFKGLSPYLCAGSAVDLDPTTFMKWEPFPYYIGSGFNKSIQDIKDWAKINRANLWIPNRELWGENGAFFDRLNDIHLGPNLFLQAEHTAQVDKMISRKLQRDFKNHLINILACSTTMEMGVDLGTLEVVMLTSVPPQPANYKQRAGRSGRNPKMVRSACITLCSSDAIGLRTLFQPLETIINRPVEVPMVDLMSPQVIQRHVNSFLIRAFGVFGSGSINQKVIDYYTNFHFERASNAWVVRDVSNRTQDPSQKLGNSAGTMYEDFDKKCSGPIDPLISADLSVLLSDTYYNGKINEVINNARENNKRCYKELNDRIEDLKCAFVGTGSSTRDERFRRKLEFDYMEILEKKLLSFWATHRFTPNANMPVSVLELDLDPKHVRDWNVNSTSSNPSYSLREAIAQYSPGNSVVVDGVVYAVRGMEFQNKYQGVNAFKRIARNNDETVMDGNVDTLSNKKEWWPGSGKLIVEMVEPVGFLPDINEEKTRIITNDRFTHVSAQLIDAKQWDSSIISNHLYKVRCNRDSGDAKILYYNEGIGYGYCLCTRCGRMVLETGVCTDCDVSNLPHDFNNVTAKKINPTTGFKEVDRSKPLYHLAISGKEIQTKCGGSNDDKVIRRNVIIGGLLQTDFSEIMVRYPGKNWMHDRTTERELLYTLGIVFTQALLDILGKDSNAVDFTVLPFGHLCIFDTNPGGAGYSNQLANKGMMDKVIDRADKILQIAKIKNSKEFLLDKHTLHYIRYVNIDKALDWIAEEKKANP